MEKFKFIEHTADIKFQAFGESLEEAFENSALAVSKSILDEPIKGKISKNIEAQGKDNERLLYEFIEELLILFDTENFLIASVEKIEIKEGKIKAEILGVNAENYEIDNHIKSVTYNEMFVREQGGKWTVQVILDV